MARVGISVLLLAWALGLGACERNEPAGGGGQASATQPTATMSAAPAPGAAVQAAKRKAQETADAAAAIIRQVREKYQENVQAELGKLDARVKELKERLATAAADARPALEKQVEEWSARLQAAREMLDKLNGASDEAWQEMRKGLDGAIREFKYGLGEEAATRPAGQSTTRPARPPA